MTDTALVLTPFSWSGPAVGLANRTWRKKVLPIGDVQYQGRMLHFTEDYLSALCDAFSSGAYDQVSFQLADAKNSHTNDPERHRGTITGLSLEPDGLYATAQVTEAGERVLAENPMLGVSARIVENYARSDGRYFPAAIQHVLGTLDPRIPQLGSWQPVEMSNDGAQVIVDLSGSSWAGEPGPPDTSLSDRELDKWLEAIDATEAEMMLNSGYGYDTEAASALAGFDATFSANWAAEAAREQARAAADAADAALAAARMKSGHVESAEAKQARLTSRACAGTYDTSFAALSHAGDEDRAVELTATTGYGLCGPPDAFGRCSAPYHQPMCLHDVSTDWMASGPPRSTFEAALSSFADEHDTGSTPAATFDPSDPDSPGYAIPQETLELAHRLNESWGLHADTGHLSPAPDFGELPGPSYAGDPYAALAAEVGRPDLAPQPQLPGGYPDVSGLARELGLK